MLLTVTFVSYIPVCNSAARKELLSDPSAVWNDLKCEYERKPKISSSLKYKNTKEKIVHRKGTRMVIDGEDWHGLQT